MLIQAYCQQEREKRCTITAKTGDPKQSDRTESDIEKMDTVESTEIADGTKTPKAEPNASPTPNDVEMVDASELVTVIKQEPEDDVTSVETDPLAETTSEENSNKSDTQPNVIKTEADENGNVEGNSSSSDNNKESDSNDEPIKIEESINDKDDPYSKDINIDPRTYCKLGHFHLLLEDYAKGRSLFTEIYYAY